MPGGPIVPALVVAALVLWVLVALLGLVGKFEGRRSRRIPTIEIPPITASMPEHADSDHHWAGEALLVSGFTVEEVACRFDTGDGGVEWARSWTSADGSTRALAITRVPGSDDPVQNESVTELTLTTKMWLGGELRDLHTTDANSAAAWKPDSWQVVRLPGASAEALWHIHRARLDEAAPDAIEPAPPGLGPELLERHQRLQEVGVAAGLLEVDGDEIVLTRAGAWALTRVHMPPWSTRYDVRDRKAADGWLTA